MKNGYRSGQFEVKRSGPKWCVEEHGSDGLPRAVDIGSYWAWKRAAKAAEIMRRIYCDGRDWDGNGPPQPESDGSLIEAWKAGGGAVSDDGRAAAWLADLPKVLRAVCGITKTPDLNKVGGAIYEETCKIAQDDEARGTLTLHADRFQRLGRAAIEAMK